ncbi:MAG: hypothetical protein A2014_07870 [Spirochaetes bacterium GWF1_49_6]|nr:MAG: hypothetical protein A2014_07870 [Spirochaetes bacterium GWF1_49_6]
MKKTVYLDATILSFLYDNRESIAYLIQITQEWWRTQRKFYQLFLSSETIREISQGDYPLKDKVIELSLTINQLEINNRIIEIAETYIENHIMPQSLSGDALHLATASFYKVDFLLTWNYKHLANGNKRQHIRIINTRLGLFTPEILTPLELLSEEE